VVFAYCGGNVTSATLTTGHPAGERVSPLPEGVALAEVEGRCILGVKALGMRVASSGLTVCALPCGNCVEGFAVSGEALV